MSEEIMTEILSETDDGFEQVRLTVNEFRGLQYLHIRKYYLDFDGDWKPTKSGVAIPITINNVANIFNALTKMLAKSDVLHIILENSTKQTRELIYEAISRKFDEESKSGLLPGDSIPF
jgi:hypothetical protein